MFCATERKSSERKKIEPKGSEKYRKVSNHKRQKKRVRRAEGFHDELNGHVFDLERDVLGQVVICP